MVIPFQGGVEMALVIEFPSPAGRRFTVDGAAAASLKDGDSTVAISMKCNGNLMVHRRNGQASFRGRLPKNPRCLGRTISENTAAGVQNPASGF
jgi:hypothetical protein